MQELEITWTRVLSVWWLYVWRGILGGMAIGFVAGAIVGVLASAMGHPEKGASLGGIVGFIIGIPWALVVLRMALVKKYKSFRIALVPLQATLLQ